MEKEQGGLAKVQLIKNINLKRETYERTSVNFPFSICNPVTADSVIIGL